MRIAVVAVICLGVIGSAARSEENTVLTGPGSKTCAEYARHYKSNPELAKALYGAWAQGFLGGMNYSAIVAKKTSPQYHLEQRPAGFFFFGTIVIVTLCESFCTPF